MTRHVLVTGGAGFIGSHLVDAYLERGWRVTIVDNLSTGDSANVNPGAHFVEADLREAATMELVRDLRPDLINHQAAQVDVRISVDDPAGDAESNVIASIRLLQTAIECGVPRFIFASSGGAMYGEPVEIPQTESHPAHPLSPYGCAKLTVENYMYYFREVQRLQTVALRYANVYGPRQSTRGEAGVIAIFTDRLLRDAEATINGTGAQTRDYVFVADVVAANMAVSELDVAGAFNVGTGVETSVVELFTMLSRLAGSNRPPKHGPPKAGEQMRSVLDGSALRSLARLSDPVAIEDGLRRTVDWFRVRRS